MEFTKQQIDELFSIKSSQPGKRDGYEVQRNTSGPAGYYDDWVALEGRKDCWTQLKAGHAGEPKKKFIFSYPIESEPSSTELALYSALINNYDCYLWPGKGKSFADARPLKDSTEFWKKKTQIPPASKEEVLEELSNQDIANINDFIIVHKKAHKKVLATIKGSEAAPLFSDRITIKEINTLSPNKGKQKRTKSIATNPIDDQEIALIKEYFPNLASIEISNTETNPDWIEKFLNKLNWLKDVSLTVDIEILTLPKNLSLASFKINNNFRRDIKSFNLNGLHTEKLTLQHCRLKNVIGIAHVKSLILSDCIPGDINLSYFHDLTEVSITNDRSQVTSIKWPDHPKIKRLTLAGMSAITELDLSQLNELEELEIQGYNLLTKIKLPDPNVLKKITITGSPITSLGPYSTSLETFICTPSISLDEKSRQFPSSIRDIGFSVDMPGQLDLGLMNGLEKVKMTEQNYKSVVTAMETVQWPNPNPVTELTFDSHSLRHDFSTFSKLKTLTLTGNSSESKQKEQQTIKLPLSGSLTQLTVKNFHDAVIDLSAQTQLQQFECKANDSITIFKVASPTLSRLELSNCKNLKKIDLSNQTELVELVNIVASPKFAITCPTPIATLTVEACPFPDLAMAKNISTLILKKNLTTEIKLPEINVRSLVIEESKESSPIKKLDLSQLKGVEEITLSGEFSQLEEIIWPENSSLKLIKFIDFNAKLDFIDLSKLTELESVVSSFLYTKPCRINCANLKKLQSFAAQGRTTGKKVTVTLNGCSSLSSVTCFSDLSGRLDLEGCNKLKNIYANADDIKIDNLTDVSSLESVTIIAKNAILLKHTVFKDLPSQCKTWFTPPSRRTQRSEIKSTLTPEQETQSELNKRSNVSYFSNKPYTGIRRATGEVKSMVASGNLQVELFSKNKIAKNNYRIHVMDRFIKNQNDLETALTERKLKNIKNPIQEWNKKLITQWKTQADLSSDYVLGYFTGVLKKGEIYPLPDSQAVEAKDFEKLQFCCDPKDAVKVFWDENSQQYCIALIAGDDVAVKGAYLVEHTPPPAPKKHAKIKYLTEDPRILLANDGFTQAEIDYLETELKKSGKFTELLNPSTPIADKILWLENYANGFDPEAKLSIDIDDDFKRLCLMAVESKGVCLERSQVFMLLAHLSGVPARLISNEVHAVCEIPYQESGKIRQQKFNLGGGLLNDLTDPALRQSMLDAIGINTSSSATTPTEDKKSEYKSYQQQKTEYIESKKAGYYHDELKKRVDASVAQDFKTILDSKQHPLIQLTKSQDPLTVNQLIIEELKNQGVNTHEKFVYIQRPEDFEIYFSPPTIAGERIFEGGLLAKLIETGGYVVVNWSTFKPEEIAHFKSVLDESAKLFHKDINSEKVKFIGLANETTVACSAALSRFKPWHLDSKIYNVTEKKPEDKKEAKEEKIMEIELDLASSPFWRTKLYGKIKNKGGKRLLEESDFIKALKSNTPLKIRLINPPNDDEFKVLMHRLNYERKILFDGSLLFINDKVQFTAVAKPQNIAKPNLIVHTKEPEDLPGKKRYLGLHNLYECLERKVYHDGQTDTAPGFFADYKKENEIFYLTENIPEVIWKDFQLQTKAAYPDDTFEFLPLPQPKINIVKPDTKLSDKSHVFLSNDPDYVTELLTKEEKNPLIVDVNPETTYSEIVARISATYEKCGVIKALENGRRVILNGEISSTLYQQLLPLLFDPPSMDCNGEACKITGQLYLVMPDNAKIKPTLLESTQCNYSLADYQHILENERKENGDPLVDIKQFYDKVNELPHRGLGIPVAPTLSYHHLKRFIHKITTEQKLHKQNPMKSIMVYDYPKKSEEYAYINVLGKYYFQPTIKKTRHSKLNKLNKKFGIFTSIDALKENAWKALNCFSGADLRDLLGTDLNQSVHYPELSDEQLETLFIKIKSSLRHSSPSVSQISHFQKQMNQLETVLGDPATPLIVIKGPAGLGKTRTVRKKLGKYHDGMAAIPTWLKEGGILLLDDINVTLPGSQDFLKGLVRSLEDGKKTIYYQGIEYPITASHKAIMTVNPESYAQRHYHPIFQKFAEIIYFQKPDREYLEKVTVKEYLEPFNLYDAALSTKLITVFEDIIHRYNSSFVTSLRDLENVSRRFIALAQHDKNLDRAMLRACVGEFSGAIKNPENRNKFVNELETLFNVRKQNEALSPLISISPKYSLPKEKSYLIESIEQDLMMRDFYLEQKENKDEIYYKSAVLLQGDPGVGKSTFFRVLLDKYATQRDESLKIKLKNELEQEGLREGSIRYQQKFDAQFEKRKTKVYSISVGSQDVYNLLMKAFNEGALVILDEYNIDEKLHVLLTQLLTGVDLNGRPADKSGFMIFASQNPSYMEGRKPLSTADINRTHFIYMDPFSEKELEALAKPIYKNDNKALVRGHHQLRSESPIANNRTFFEGIKDIRLAPENDYQKTWDNDFVPQVSAKLREILKDTSHWEIKTVKGVTLPPKIIEMRNIADEQGISDRDFLTRIKEVASQRSIWTLLTTFQSNDQQSAEFCHLLTKCKSHEELMDSLAPNASHRNAP